MGNSNSAYVQLDRGAFQPSESLTGNAYVTLKDVVKINAVLLKVVGEERTHWTEQRGGNKKRSSTQHFYGRNTHFAVKLPLMQAATLAPGSYQFPFQVQLPPDLPTSMSWAYGSASAHITYTVQVEVDKAGFFSWDIKSKPIVFQVFHNQNYASTAIDISGAEQVNFCCCINKGIVHGRLMAPATVLHLNSSLPLSAEIKNSTTIPLRNVKASTGEQDIGNQSSSIFSARPGAASISVMEPCVPFSCFRNPIQLEALLVIEAA